ncbi:MAG: hypothetical protein VXZ82_21210 [Planctomycetota bacterium]|nr:hypothetical protein [Planctomycetota bacterium]
MSCYFVSRKASKPFQSSPAGAIPAACGLLTVLVLPLSVCAQEAEEIKPDGPWISDVAWDGNDHVVGTNSQGLLLRPAKLVRAGTTALGELDTIGESETSLWSVLSVGDGQWLASDYKGGLHLIGNGSGKIEAETRWVRALCATPEAGKVLAGTEDGKVLLLSITEKKELSRVDAHKAAVFAIAFNAAGDQVATAGGDGVIKVHSWPELKPLAEMTRGSEAIWSLSFVDGDSKIVSGGADRRLQLWDVATAASVCTITRTRDWITDLFLLPDSKVVCATCMDGKIVVADYGAMTKVAEAEVAESAIWSAALNGKKIALGTRKNGLQIAEVGDWIAQAQTVTKEVAKVRPPAPKR